MLLTKEVEVELAGINAKRYEELGYKIPKKQNINGKKYIVPGTKIKVKVEDLPRGSNVIVQCLCDYCLDEGKKKIIYKKYNKYIKNRNSFPKDCCKECGHKKIEDIVIRKNELKELTKNDRGYWKIKENRMKELNEYIQQFNNIDHMRESQWGTSIADAFVIYKDDLLMSVAELGYDIPSLSDFRYKPNGYYNIWENLKLELENFYKEFGYSPSCEQINKDLHINNRYLSNFGGYPKIRELLGWKNNYVDESGFYNDSFNEMIFANYLIKNNISYSRYEKPYPNEGKFTCDFCFTTKDGIKYYCEIWGYPKNKNEDNMIISDYNKTRKIKESLYKKYNLNLISIEGMIFNYKSSKIQQVLYKILKPYLNYDFIEVDYSCLRPAPKMTDKMLLEEALSYSKDGITLPSPDILNSNGLSGIYNEIRKRYNNYHVFAEKFGFKTTSKNGYWNIDIIFEKFDYMLEKYGKILNTSELAKQVKQDENLKGLNHAISTFGYFRDVLLQYYEYLLNQKRTIPDIEINRLKQIAGIKPDYNKSKEEDKQKALNILSKIKLVS